ncbi:hypothetical protein ACIOC1_06190 [Streptomyces sp. NPDC088197]|uniref:hypothetical protein n=1 Tax=Streptomyces sp. NPDC088197 TaxID=3365840 RepID=UPI00380620D1
MLGDDAQQAESDGSRNRATSGPRHAAPRKSLLTKLHVPAGKAVALAAMPTAVLMGMGFTPHLAQADEMPKNPYKPGPCVTQSDTPSPSASKSAADGKATDKPGGQETSKPTTGPSPSSSPSPSTSPEAPAPTDSAKAPSSDSGADSKTENTSRATGTPSATPSPTKSVNPWDPLGLGDLVSGLLGGGKTPTATPTTQAPQPDPAPTTAKPEPSTSPSASAPAKGDDPVGTAGKTVKDTVDTAVGGLDKTVKDTKDAAKDAKDAAKGAKDKASPSATPSAGGTDDPQSYPCPVYDAKALADADVEQGIPLLPDTPWVLKTTKLTLHGLSYHGIVKVKTHNGTVKDVLKFTVSGIDIDNLHQIVDGPKGTKTNVEAAKGSTSKFTNGTVTLYTESLSGNLLGLIPITFTPKAPPPLTLPELFFTNATVIQAAQFGGTLHVPGMHIYGTPG